MQCSMHLERFMVAYHWSKTLSVQTRIAKTVELGADNGHNARLAEEQQLLQSIETHLKDRQ